MLHLCYLSALVNRQRQAGTHEGILSTQADGLPDRDLYADHTHICTCTYAKHTSGELRVALFLYTSSYAVSHRSLPLAHGHTETHTTWQSYTFPCPVSSGARIRERWCNQWTMNSSHPPLALSFYEKVISCALSLGAQRLNY